MTEPGRATRSAATLKPGARLGEFEVLRVLAHGPHAVVYEAAGPAGWTRVAIKECLPEVICERVDGIVRSRGAPHDVVLDRVRAAFLHEARTLAGLSHPALLPVTAVWEQDGTAYRAMPWIAGDRLADLRPKMPRAPDEATVRALLEPLLDALQMLHGRALVHGATSPANVMLGADDKPVLMDFGAVRRELARHLPASAQDLSRDPYLAPEQISGGELGPWTDLYSLAATGLFALDGMPSGAVGGGPLRAALRAALRPAPSDRPDSVARFRSELARQSDLQRLLPSGPAGGAAAGDSPALIDLPASAVRPARIDMPDDLGETLARVARAARQQSPQRHDGQVPIDGLRVGSPALPKAGHASRLRSRAPGHRPSEGRRALVGGVVALGVAVLGAAAWWWAARSADEAAPGLAAAGKSKATVAPITAPALPTIEQLPPPAAGPASRVSPVAAARPAPAPAASPNPPANVVVAKAARPDATAAASAAQVLKANPVARAPSASTPAVPRAPTAASGGASVAAQAQPAPPPAAPPAATAAVKPAAAPSTPRPPAAKMATVANAPSRPATSGSPRAECGARTEFSLYRCMQTQCAQTRWRAHPQCVKLRETDTVD